MHARCIYSEAGLLEASWLCSYMRSQGIRLLKPPAMIFFLLFCTSVGLAAGATNAGVIEGMVVSETPDELLRLSLLKVNLRGTTRIFETRCAVALRSGVRFQCTDINEGCYLLVAQREQDSAVAYYPHGSSIASAEPICVRANTGLDLLFSPSFAKRSTLTVFLPQGSTPRSLGITAVSPVGGEIPLQFAATWNTYTGSYSVALHPGDYVLRALWGQADTLASQVTKISTTAANKEITLSDDSQQITGEVLTSEAPPPSIQLEPLTPYLETVALAVEQGHFTYSGLSAGPYKLEAEGYALSITEPMKAVGTSTNEIMVMPGDDLHLRITAVRFRPKVYVHLLRDDKTPSDLWFLVSQDGGRLIATLQPTAGGTFEVLLPSPAKYTVQACRAPYGPVFPSTAEYDLPYEVVGSISAISEGDSIQTLEISLGDASHISHCSADL